MAKVYFGPVAPFNDAHRCFLATNMDVLVLENFVLLKKEQPDAKDIDVEAYLSQFQLD